MQSRKPWIMLPLLFACLIGTTPAAGQAEDRPPPSGAGSLLPAEETRLDNAVFRAGLKKRGLLEVLELHQSDYPPASPVERLLMRRDIRLAESRDAERPRPARRTALTQANDLLEQIVRENPGDPRRFAWRYELARSLLYEEAEPYATSVLYREGRRDERTRLRELAGRAVTTLTDMLTQLEAEYQRIDGLSVEEFELLDRHGYIDEIDRLGPAARYLRLWSMFYEACGREDDDPARTSTLREVRDALTADSAWLQTPHERSRIQVQSQLLAGMTARRLHDTAAARDYLDRSIAAAERLTDPDERERLDWAVSLARIERIRAAQDEGRFDEALWSAQRLTTREDASRADTGLSVVGMLLERSIRLARARASAEAGRARQAQQDRRDAWHVPAEKTRTDDQLRQALYTTLHDLIEPDRDPADLDPLQQAAQLAGLLAEAEALGDNVMALLDRAVHVGEAFLADHAASAALLLPEVLYHLAVTRYRRGDADVAAGHFLALARDHHQAPHAVQAAEYAVQLAAQVYAEAPDDQRARAFALYREALDVLTTRYAAAPAAHTWRYFYAQLLDDAGEYDLAAGQYARVPADSPHHAPARFGRVRALALHVRQLAARPDADRATVRAEAQRLYTAQHELVALLTTALEKGKDDDRQAELRLLRDESRLLLAEVHVLPMIDHAEQALSALAELEATHPAQSGRIWRARLLALERLGRLEDAAEAIPRFVEADPDGAAHTLQALLDAVATPPDGMIIISDNGVSPRARFAVVLADALHALDQRAAGGAAAESAVQRGLALLWAGRWLDARDAFADHLTPPDQPLPESRALRLALLGDAEALYQMLEFRQALPRFNRLATTLAPQDTLRWQALLRDLQCRQALGHDPSGIIRVIEQQRFLHPGLGGPQLSAAFDALHRAARERIRDAG